MANYIPNTEL